MRLKKALFIFLFALISINAKPDSTINPGSVKEIPVSKIVHDGEVTIKNKSDKDFWDIFPPILALAAIMLSGYSVKKQSEFSNKQLVSQTNIAQRAVDERSIRQTIDSLLNKTERVSELIFNLIEKTRIAGFPEDELISIYKEISYVCGSISYYLRITHQEFDTIGNLALAVITKTGEFVNFYSHNGTAVQIDQSRTEILDAEKALFNMLHAIIDMERDKLERLL